MGPDQTSIVAQWRGRGGRAILATTVMLAAHAANADGNIAEGRKLAIAHCTVCHVVGDHNKFGGISSFLPLILNTWSSTSRVRVAERRDTTAMNAASRCAPG